MTLEVEVKDGLLVAPLPDFQDGTYEIKISSLDTRTAQQNRAFWLWMTMIASKFNRDKVKTTQVLRPDTTWNKDKVKNMFVDPVLEAEFNTTSTTKLKKNDYDKLIDVMTKAFGSRGVQLPEFPSIENKEKDTNV